MTGFNQFLKDKNLNQDAEPAFKRFLNKRGISAYGLHKLSGLSKSLCFDYCAGRVRPSKKTALRIAAALRLPASDVLREIEVREAWENGLSPKSRYYEKPGPSRLSPTYCRLCRQLITEAA